MQRPEKQEKMPEEPEKRPDETGMERDGSSVCALLTTVSFLLVIGGFFLANLIVPNPSMLASERRPPAAFPDITRDSLLGEDFMENFDAYANDNFVLREPLRTMRAAVVLDVFRQTDKSGLYLGASGVGKFEPILSSSYAQAAKKINNVVSACLPGARVFVSVVPDKSIYAGRAYPGFDPVLARHLFQEGLPGLTYIDLTGALTAADFYRTDLHWDQTRLGGVMDALGLAMGFSPVDVDPKDIRRLGPFEGVYPGQLALPVPPDDLSLVTSDALGPVKVSYLNPDTAELQEGPLYDEAAFSGRDPYDVFLSGAQPLIVLTNEQASTDRSLILFRDSFASSLAPLLAASYARVTLVDLRYFDSRMLPYFIEDTQGVDALFLYSSQILNHAEVLLAPDSQ